MLATLGIGLPSHRRRLHWFSSSPLEYPPASGFRLPANSPRFKTKPAPHRFEQKSLLAQLGFGSPTSSVLSILPIGRFSSRARAPGLPRFCVSPSGGRRDVRGDCNRTKSADGRHISTTCYSPRGSDVLRPVVITGFSIRHGFFKPLTQLLLP